MTWTTFASLTTPFPMSALYVYAGVGTNAEATQPAGGASFDNLDVLP